MTTQPVELQFIGAGRSAQVFRGQFADGTPFAQKIFTGEGTSRAVLKLLTGAENPYRWQEAAMATAIARRKVLDHLLQYWFGEMLRLPATYDWGWNENHKAYQFRVELIQGQHVPLKNPVQSADADYYAELTGQIMQPLQQHLRAAGFDGMLWQAGLGNPVAANNFMLEPTVDGHRWVWIDMESGVPALFALNIWRTLSFYLPKSVLHRRPLFDDVDLGGLHGYLVEHEKGLVEALGIDRWVRLNADVRELAEAQVRWKGMNRLQRGIQSSYKMGKISAEEVMAYHMSPRRWYARQAGSTLASTGEKLRRLPAKLADKCRAVNWRQLGRNSVKFFGSTAFRATVAQDTLEQRIDQWHQRGVLTEAQSAQLAQGIRRDNATELLTDFVMHMGIKPPAKLLAYGIVPLLWLLGQVDTLLAAFLVVMMGAICRTLYTGYRFAQAWAKRQTLPWVALLLSPLPMVGNMAYPAELLTRSIGTAANLPRFILADLAAGIGRRLPIWGGEDTGTEHGCLRLTLKVIDVLAWPRQQMANARARAKASAGQSALSLMIPA